MTDNIAIASYTLLALVIYFYSCRLKTLGNEQRSLMSHNLKDTIKTTQYDIQYLFHQNTVYSIPN